MTRACPPPRRLRWPRDQPVALKFLPEGVAADPARLAQFHNELRIARQVSHKNVCRLYDLGEADGRRFLTMEYMDGEDLASLLGQPSAQSRILVTLATRLGH